MDRLNIANAHPGYYLVRSTSTTVYVLDATGPRPRMMRSTIAGTRTGRGWWDNQWAPLVSVEAGIPDGHGLIVVGSRVRWVADPGGRTDAREWWWISRPVTSIERVSAEDLDEFLAGRGSPDEEAASVLEDETDALTTTEDRRRRAHARRAHLLGEMTRNAVEDGLYDTSAEDYTEALRHARGKGLRDNEFRPGTDPDRRAGLTEQANAALERSGQDNESATLISEANRRLQSQNYEEWEVSPRGHIEADAETAATAEERRRHLDEVLDEIDERWRDVLDRLGREEDLPES